MTHEALRGLLLGRGVATALALAWIGLLQLPSARRWTPPLRPGDVRARLVALLGRSGAGS